MEEEEDEEEDEEEEDDEKDEEEEEKDVKEELEGPGIITISFFQPSGYGRTDRPMDLRTNERRYLLYE